MRSLATPTIVFDLDGTLVDTVPDIAAALDHALAPYRCSATSPAEAATLMGDGLNEVFWRALVTKRLDLPAQEADTARRRFVAAYRMEPARHSTVYPGISALLAELRGQGALTAVCTNKIEAIALDILDALDLTALFDAVVGSHPDRPMKPHPRPLEDVVGRAGGSIARTLLVGDTGADNGAAVAAGIPVILLTHGYSHVPIRSYAYGTIVEDMEGLREKALTFLKGEPIAPIEAPPRNVLCQPGATEISKDSDLPFTTREFVRLGLAA